MGKCIHLLKFDRRKLILRSMLETEEGLNCGFDHFRSRSISSLYSFGTARTSKSGFVRTLFLANLIHHFHMKATGHLWLINFQGSRPTCFNASSAIQLIACRMIEEMF